MLADSLWGISGHNPLIMFVEGSWLHLMFTINGIYLKTKTLKKKILGFLRNFGGIVNYGIKPGST